MHGVSMNYLVISDIHLGHRRTPTSHIVESLIDNLLTEENKKLDVFFIAGDLFDRLLDFNSQDVYCIIDFIHRLLSFCYDNDILLRILEGTPSHDWKQSYVLVKMNELRKNKCNLKYFSVLDIEYIDKYDKYILYIPDEWCKDHDSLELQIKSKLSLYNISSVDIGILHGQFKYQIKHLGYTGFHFKEEYFLGIVKGYIHVGHYHIHTKLDRILANGSLERLAHGEEDPKGYIRVIDDRYTFIENVRAYKYVTINATKNISINKLDSVIKTYPKGSYIRLIVNKTSDFNINFRDLKLRYLDYHLTKLIKENLTDINSVTHIVTSIPLELPELVNFSNLYGNIKDTITESYNLSENENIIMNGYMENLKKLTEVSS